MRKPQPFYAVIVTVLHLDHLGHTLYTSVRAYERGQKHIGRDAFVNFAVGDMLRLVAVTWDGGQFVSGPVKFVVHEFGAEDYGNYVQTCETELDMGPGAYPVQEGRWS